MSPSEQSPGGDRMREQVLREAAAQTLRAAGAVFAFVHGSRASGNSRPDSDLDLAAWWRADPPQSFEVLLPVGVDLLVLNSAPLELAGRVALGGVLLFDDDPSARVNWVAQTRKIYLTSGRGSNAATGSSQRV